MISSVTDIDKVYLCQCVKCHWNYSDVHATGLKAGTYRRRVIQHTGRSRDAPRCFAVDIGMLQRTRWTDALTLTDTPAVTLKSPFMCLRSHMLPCF